MRVIRIRRNCQQWWI
uniref:Truncated envelope glycoprotein n=1 Tax=Human immunodeficiency virus type 1 TaxID=11676 RepID=A0A0H3Y8W6_HV1|nr:truncated envelope glycoprotein [Human immunodeficiency virus 1]